MQNVKMMDAKLNAKFAVLAQRQYCEMRNVIVHFQLFSPEILSGTSAVFLLMPDDRSL